MIEYVEMVSATLAGLGVIVLWVIIKGEDDV